MGFADAYVTEEDDIGLVGQELQVEEVLDRQAVDLLGLGPVELFECFEDREAGAFDPCLDAALVLGLVFTFDQSAQVFQMIPVLAGGFGGQGRVLVGQVMELEI